MSAVVESNGDISVRVYQAVAVRLDARDNADESERRAALTGEDRRQFVRHLANDELRRISAEQLSLGLEPPDADESARVTQRVLDRLFGLDRLQALVDDARWTDIVCNGCDQVFLRRRDNNEWVTGPPVADSDDELTELIRTAARRGRTERQWDQANPSLNLQLPSGDRLHAVGWVTSRPSISIRRHNFDLLHIDQLVEAGTLSPSLRAFLAAAVRAKRNIVIAGGTGAGKTTLLRCLINEIPPEERLITVEDSAEIGMERLAEWHPNFVDFESRPPNVEGVGAFPLHQATTESLRMQPDRVIVGEIRGDEVVPMLKAMSQGSEGSLTTVHADSSEGVFLRLQMYSAMSPERFAPAQTNLMVANAIHLIVHLARLEDTNARAVTSVREISGVDATGTVISSNEVYGPDETGRAVPRFAVQDPTLRRLERAGFDRRWLDPDLGRWDT